MCISSGCLNGYLVLRDYSMEKSHEKRNGKIIEGECWYIIGVVYNKK